MSAGPSTSPISMLISATTTTFFERSTCSIPACISPSAITAGRAHAGEDDDRPRRCAATACCFRTARPPGGDQERAAAWRAQRDSYARSSASSDGIRHRPCMLATAALISIGAGRPMDSLARNRAAHGTKSSTSQGQQAGARSRHAPCLRDGYPIAIPTETVYGLAADATNPAAIARIYETKGRPRFNPLICHVAGLAMAERVSPTFDPLSRAGRSLLARSADARRCRSGRDQRDPCACNRRAGHRRHPRCRMGFAARADRAPSARPLAAPSANTSGQISADQRRPCARPISATRSADPRCGGAVPVGRGIDHRQRRGRRAEAAAPGRSGRSREIERSPAADCCAPARRQRRSRHRACSPPIMRPVRRCALDATDRRAGEALIAFGGGRSPGRNRRGRSQPQPPAAIWPKAAANLFDYHENGRRQRRGDASRFPPFPMTASAKRSTTGCARRRTAQSHWDGSRLDEPASRSRTARPFSPQSSATACAVRTEADLAPHLIENARPASRRLAAAAEARTRRGGIRHPRSSPAKPAPRSCRSTGNTGLVGGQTPREGGSEIIVSLERMNKIREIDPASHNVLVGGWRRILAEVAEARRDEPNRHPSAARSARGLVPDRRQPLDQCRRHRRARLWQHARSSASGSKWCCPPARSGRPAQAEEGQYRLRSARPLHRRRRHARHHHRAPC